MNWIFRSVLLIFFACPYKGLAAETPSTPPLTDAHHLRSRPNHQPRRRCLRRRHLQYAAGRPPADAPTVAPSACNIRTAASSPFTTNASDHNLDGWSEYAVSKDGGKTWQKYNKFAYSHETYQKDPKRPAWVEEGLVTNSGTVVLFVTHFDEKSRRVKSVVMRSTDNGSTWTDATPLDADFVGYPTAVAVSGDTNYVLFDSVAGPPRPLRQHRRRQDLAEKEHPHTRQPRVVRRHVHHGRRPAPRRSLCHRRRRTPLLLHQATTMGKRGPNRNVPASTRKSETPNSPASRENTISTVAPDTTVKAPTASYCISQTTASTGTPASSSAGQTQGPDGYSHNLHHLQ